LILGTGGASKAVAAALKMLNIDFLYVSRTAKNKNTISYNELTPELVEQHKLIINTTPIGMFPETGIAPDIPYGNITTDHLLFDLIYNPEETLFLKKGKEKGAKTKNGLEMLHLQADEAWKIWNSTK